MKVQVFLEEREITSELMLRETLTHRKDKKYGAFWLIDDHPIFALFINDDDACIYFMPETEDDKWSTNPEFNGGEDETLDFLIENYQQDDLSREFVIPTEKGIEAFVHFYNTRELTSEIAWS